MAGRSRNHAWVVLLAAALLVGCAASEDTAAPEDTGDTGDTAAAEVDVSPLVKERAVKRRPKARSRKGPRPGAKARKSRGVERALDFAKNLKASPTVAVAPAAVLPPAPVAPPVPVVTMQAPNPEQPQPELHVALPELSGVPRYHRGELPRLIHVVQGPEDIAALQGRTRLMGTLVIEESDLTDLRGLESIERIGGLIVNDNRWLRSLAGLENLETIDGGVEIQSNDVLLDLDGLRGVEEVGYTLAISNNPLLIDLDGLNGLRRVGYDMQNCGPEAPPVVAIFFNGLVDMSGLEGLEGVAGELDLRDNLQPRVAADYALADRVQVGCQEPTFPVRLADEYEDPGVPVKCELEWWE